MPTGGGIICGGQPLNTIGPGFEWGCFSVGCAPCCCCWLPPVGVEQEELGEFLLVRARGLPAPAAEVVVVGVCVLWPDAMALALAGPSVVELTVLGELICAMWADL